MEDDLTQHYPVIRRYARTLASPFHPVEDIVQETYLQAYLSLRVRGPPRRPLPWLKTIAERAVLHQYGKRSTYQATNSTHEDVSCVAEPSPLAQLIQREEIHRLRRALAEISALDQLLLYQFHGDDRSTRDLAVDHHLSLAAVKTRLCRARSRLKDLLQGGGFE